MRVARWNDPAQIDDARDVHRASDAPPPTLRVGYSALPHRASNTPRPNRPTISIPTLRIENQTPPRTIAPIF